MADEFGPKRLIKIRDAARLLGLSERWVWERVGEGTLPVIRLKGATRVAIRDLEKFVQSGLAK